MNFWNRYRNYISFWILGLSNNYSYVIMLSAAFDIISTNEPKSDDSGDDNKGFKCNSSSTGAVLIADILPCLLIKLFAPFVFTNTNLRVSIVVILSALSFVITSFSVNIYFSYIGIICASLSSGLGETTFLSYTSKFDSRVISYWSSGTGASGLLGSMSYALLTTIGLSPNNTLLVMLFIPLLMTITFWCFISIKQKEDETSSPLMGENDSAVINTNIDGSGDIIISNQESTQELTFYEMTAYIKKLLKYMIPLMLVYLFEYFINQGLFEMVYFPNIWLTHSQQYRWYNVVYQIGVLISRSSIGLIHIKETYILAILQFINVLIVLFQIWIRFIPNIWIMLTIVLWEGLLGGLAYVNTFYRLYNEITPKYKEYSLSITTLSDSIGITIAGFTALPVHDFLCKVIKF